MLALDYEVEDDARAGTSTDSWFRRPRLRDVSRNMDMKELMLGKASQFVNYTATFTAVCFLAAVRTVADSLYER